jgi:cytidine deaminase
MTDIMALAERDYELIEEAKRTFDTLFLPGVHEVAAAVRTVSGEVFCGIHIEADVGFADVCGEVAAICHAVAHGPVTWTRLSQSMAMASTTTTYWRLADVAEK